MSLFASVSLFQHIDERKTLPLKEPIVAPTARLIFRHRRQSFTYLPSAIVFESAVEDIPYWDIYDTGASSTFISEELAGRLKEQNPNMPLLRKRRELVTANGNTSCIYQQMLIRFSFGEEYVRESTSYGLARNQSAASTRSRCYQVLWNPP